MSVRVPHCPLPTAARPPPLPVHRQAELSADERALEGVLPRKAALQGELKEVQAAMAANAKVRGLRVRTHARAHRPCTGARGCARTPPPLSTHIPPLTPHTVCLCFPLQGNASLEGRVKAAKRAADDSRAAEERLNAAFSGLEKRDVKAREDVKHVGSQVRAGAAVPLCSVGCVCVLAWVMSKLRACCECTVVCWCGL